MLAHRTERWTLTHLCVATTLLTACASSPTLAAQSLNPAGVGACAARVWVTP
jgi:hypothetical protein